MWRICCECCCLKGCTQDDVKKVCIDKNGVHCMDDCPKSNAEITSIICDECIDERRKTRKFDGVGIS